MTTPSLRPALLLLAAFAAALPTLVSAAPKKILVVTVTTGFRHSSIPTGEKVLTQLAQKTGDFTVDFVQQPAGMPKAPARPRPGPKGTEDPAYQNALKNFAAAEQTYRAAYERWLPSVADALKPLQPDNLKQYDAVVFVSTTGDLPLPDKMGFLKWISEGHAFVGIHAAADTFHGFPAFISMLGGEFARHGPQVGVDCLNDDPAHPATKGLPASWPVFDEIYQFKNFDRATVHSLLSLDKHPNDKTPGFFPVSWCKRYGSGRVFYTSLGHREDVWDPATTEGGPRKNPPELAQRYQQHVLGGLRWALGLAEGNAEPQRASAGASR